MYTRTMKVGWKSFLNYQLELKLKLALFLSLSDVWIQDSQTYLKPSENINRSLKNSQFGFKMTGFRKPLAL